MYGKDETKTARKLGIYHLVDPNSPRTVMSQIADRFNEIDYETYDRFMKKTESDWTLPYEFYNDVKNFMDYLLHPKGATV